MTELEKWKASGAVNDWQMPAVAAWKRWPVIRHCRALWHKWQVEGWYSSGPGILGIRTGYDDWVLFGIWHGLERRID